MSALFLNIFNLAINASWLILAVIVTRLILKKAPKWIFCLLWGLVAVRLLCPVSLESACSLLPSGKVVPENIEIVQNPHIDSGVRIIDNAVNSVIERSFSPDDESSVNPMQVVVFVASVIWLTGMTAMLIYALISFLLLRRKVQVSVVVSGRVQECDEIGSPFILGIFQPVIYVPSGMNEKMLEPVIAHEEAHLKRHDHWWKPFGFLLLSVYWFHPLCWVAYILLCQDIEAACDEMVIRDKDRNYMAAYSQALLDCSAHRRIIAACPLAFGETVVKERVRRVLNYKKPTFWVIVSAIIACIVVAMCFMTNPRNRYYDITVDIPAGSEINTVWFADEEISPKDNTLNLDAGNFYRGTIVIQAADGGIDGLEQTAQLRSGAPVTFQVESGVWYRIGIRMEMSTRDEDVSLKVRVRNIEVRIASEADGVGRDTKSWEALASVQAEQENVKKREAELSGAMDFAPEDIHDVVAADIWIAGTALPPELGLSESGSYQLHCGDPDKLKDLEAMLSGAKPEKGQSGCPFYTALYLTRSDGTIGTVFPATDSCAMYLSGRECYKYSDSTNEALWSLIGEFELVNGTENTGMDNPIGLTMTAVDIIPTGCKLDERGKISYTQMVEN